MAGRYTKYGDLKRLEALRRGRGDNRKLERAGLTAMRRRSKARPYQQKTPTPAAVKTFKTALVIIPPEDLWAPIQGLRRQYDRHFRRWMPHITLLYPFRPASTFEALAPRLAHACAALAPFEVKLTRFDLFLHSRRNSTLYLLPEPDGSLQALQAAVMKIVPDCDDVSRLPGGFKPHLSVGQVRSRDADALREQCQAIWQPLAFTVTQVALIWRNDAPDDVFRPGQVVELKSSELRA